MLNLKKAILGLGLLGVVSSANAAYIELPGYYKQVKTGGSIFNPVYTMTYFPLKRAINYLNIIAIENGAFLVSSYLSTSEECSQGAADDPMVCTTTTHSNVDTKFFKSNQKITDVAIGCNVAYGTRRGDTCPTASITYPIVRDGTIDDSGNVVLNSGYDDTILKAKIQALETKVYQCVQ